MTKFEAKILNPLIDKYERSKTFSGKNAVHQNFEIKPEKVIPRYLDEAEYELFTNVNEAIATLEQLGYLHVTRRADVVQTIRLNLEHLSDCYQRLGRYPKANQQAMLKNLLLQYQNRNPLLERYCETQLLRLADNKTIQGFDGERLVFEQCLKVLEACFTVEEETFQREFSARVLGDSKAFEKIRKKVGSILWEYGDFPDYETLFDDLNILKNPGHVYLKGDAKMVIGGQTIDLRYFKGDIAISSIDLRAMIQFEVRCQNVMTIENLTTFHAYPATDACAIYLGGFHNQLRRDFICKIHAQNPKQTYWHYGDIDAGGLYILQHLRRQTQIPFEPFRMDVETLRSHLAQTRPLTENDRKRLAHFIGSEFDTLVRFMLEHDCKLEQEQLA